MAATDNRAGNVPQPYSNLPASPTLTNPDMILPDYDDLSPGLDDHDNHHDLRDQSTLMMWKSAHAAASSADLQQLFSSGPLSGNMSSGSLSGPLSGPLSNSLSAQDHHTFPSGPITPTTPIIYGNGTMLSDIGEVTEAESTPGRASPSYGRHIGGSNSQSRSPSPTLLTQSVRHQFSHNHHHTITSRESLGGTPRRSSPSMAHDDGNGGSGSGSSGGERSGDRIAGIKERARQQQSRTMMRRDSIDSNSTITTEDQAGLFADFDDAVSVGDDSVFQGDDEESNAESYVPDETYLARQVPIASVATASMIAATGAGAGAVTPTNSGYLVVPGYTGPGASSSGNNTSDEGDRRLSAASLSLRAEQILANAKKRLTTMEGNLNRARSSLYVIPPSFGSLPSDGSTPPRTPVRSATASSRYHDPTPGSPMHARMASDGSMPIDDVSGGVGTNGTGNAVSSTNGLNGFPQRSASALGAAGGYRQPTGGVGLESYQDQQRLEDIQDSLTGGYHRAGLNRPVDIVLERLDESNSAPNTAIRHEYLGDDILSPAARSETQLDSYLSPTYSSYSNGTSGSGASDKGLGRSGSVVQMRDLKGQVKDLKGKISSLREQARADSLKRRSMQSLRTPSPFTHSQVDQWYADSQPQQKQSGTSTPQQTVSQEQQEQQYQQEQITAEINGRSPWNGELESVDDDGNGNRKVVMPPAHTADAQAANAGSNGSGSGSRYSGQSQRTTPTHLTADKTDQDSFMSRYEEPAEIATGLSYSSNSKTLVGAGQSSESPILRGAQRSGTASDATPPAATFSSRFGRQHKNSNDVDDDFDNDDNDDARTENGDFDDAVEEGERHNYQLQTQPSLEDVFVDAIDVDEIYEPGQDDQDDQEQYASREYNDYANYANDPNNATSDNDGYESESGESMYHDTLQHPISHEDREDAFDYEHFILHSALGTISQQRLAHGRSGSFSSDDSVETTRGPSTALAASASAATDNYAKGRGAYPTKSPSRRTSMISIATIESVDSMESFATATEGRSSRVSRMSRNSRINLMGPHESSFEDVAEDSFEDVEDTSSNYTSYSNRNSMIVNQNYPPIPSTGTAAAAAGAALTAANSSSVAVAKDRPDSVVLARAAATAHQAASGSESASASASTDSLASFATASKRNSTEELRQTQKPYVARRPASSAAMPSHRPSVSSFESTGTTRSFPLVNRNRVGSLNAISGTAGYPAYRSASSNNGSNSPSSTGPTPTPTQGHRPTLSASASSLASSAKQSPPLTRTQFQPTSQIQTQSQTKSQPQAQVSDEDAELRSISETLMNETVSVCEQQQLEQANDGAGGQVQAQTLQALLKDDQYLVERLVANLGRCVLGLSESGRASTESRMYRRRIDAARRILEGLDTS